MNMPSTAFERAVLEVFQKLAASIQDEVPPGHVRAYISGGAAMHWLTHTRVSDDVDAIMSHNVLLPAGLIAAYCDSDGQERRVEYDTNYNPTLSLLHPDYQQRARPVALSQDTGSALDVFVLAPVDLAITKLARFAARDQQDIQVLIDRGLLCDAEQFRALAQEALGFYVGQKAIIKENINDVFDWIAHKHHNANKPTGPRPGG